MNNGFNNNNSNINKFMNEKIGFGKYQILSLIILCFIDFNDGVELMIFNIITPILKEKWGLKMSQIELMGFLYYFSMFIGSISSGYFSDKFGRRICLIFSSLGQTLTVTLFLFIQNYYQFLFLRLSKNNN